jgi:hypothetical protein
MATREPKKRQIHPNGDLQRSKTISAFRKSNLNKCIAWIVGRKTTRQNARGISLQCRQEYSAWRPNRSRSPAAGCLLFSEEGETERLELLDMLT